MKQQCPNCFKRFQLSLDTSVPVTADFNTPHEFVYCPWCGARNGAVEKGSILKIEKTENPPSDF